MDIKYAERLMFRLAFFSFLLPAALLASPPPDSLVTAMACGNCHYGLPAQDSMYVKAPDLTYAGERYNPAYLFQYLQQPQRIRLHIGASRMPDFHLDAREALALALYLEQQLFTGISQERIAVSQALYGTGMKFTADPPRVIKTVGCLQCHRLHGQGERKAVDLEETSYRLRAEWVKRFVAAPDAYSVPEKIMPSPFYVWSAAEQAYKEVEPYSAAKINLFTDYLWTLNRDKIRAQQQAFAQAKRDNPEITPETGERIFLALNCMACHKFSNRKPLWEKNAPDLSIEGWRVRQDWLREYLQKPVPIRPSGYEPGSGSRMPDFLLSAAEVAELVAFLMQQRQKVSPAPVFTPDTLSRYAMRKAETLLREKQSCLGCHRLGKFGGVIGPDLSSLSRRLQPDFVYRMITAPDQLLSPPVMPKILMAGKYTRLFVSYLLQQEVALDTLRRFSLASVRPYFYQQYEGAEALYVQHCAACHGLAGNADGFNAAYLPKPPTKHSDAAYMATRPDDTLFDGIHAGGYILNKSQYMPPFGQSLSYEQIRQLVAHMRTLCACKQPDWAGDNH